MKKHIIENYTLAGIIGTTVLSGILLSLPHVSADDGAVSNVAIRVNSACSVSVSPEGSNDTPHTADLNPGTYQANIGKTTIKTTCNDANGFSIYAIGYTDEEYGNTVLKPETVDSSNSIITGTATSAGNPDTSNWAMKISAVTGTYAPSIQSDTDGPYSDYHIVPSTYAKVATKSSGTDITGGSSIEMTYSAYIAGTQPADLYNGKVKFTMVHPATEPAPYTGETTQSGKICYYSGVTDSEGTMGCQNVASSATLLASNFSRIGYGFAGWTDRFDYATNNTAKYYGPNETISIPDTSIYTGEGKGLSLYAVWIKSAGSLQDSTKVATLCGSGTGSLTQAPIDGTAGRASVSALTDERDNQTYAIAKLADGNCWMIENLRLADTHQEGTSTVPTTLTTANTHNPLNDGTTVTLKHNYTDTNTFTNLSSTSAAKYNADTAPEGWCGSVNATCLDQSRLRTDNTANRETSNPASNNGSIYSYGNYYNWYSATAGRGNSSIYSGDVVGDLCPAGWRLPLGNTSTGDIEQGASDTTNKVGGFSYLDRKMGGTGAGQSTSAASLRWRKFPLNFLYSGETDDGSSLRNRGLDGYYWSSEAYTEDRAYLLSLGSSILSPGYIYFRFVGFSVRCLADF